MHIFPVIIDSQPAYARACGASIGVLGMPSGAESVLARLCREIAAVTFQRPTIFTAFGLDAGYREALLAQTPYAVDWPVEQRFSQWLAEREPSDLLLMIDPRTCPIERVDLQRLVEDLRDVRVAQFMVGMEGSAGGTEELALFDDHGNIRRVQRYYDNVTRMKPRGVFAGLVPATSLRVGGQPTIESLTRIRASLAGAGLPQHDLTLGIPLVDLHQPRGLLDLNEHALRRITPVLDGYNKLSDGVYVAETADVDPSAVVLGPVVIQAGAQVERNALLIGPAVIGAGAVVGHDAEVVQSVVVPGAVLASLRSARHQISFSQQNPGSEESEYSSLADATAFSAIGLHDESSQLDPAHNRPRTRTYRWMKRLTDIAVAALGLLVTLPLTLVLAVLIKATSRGPVFFAHSREGRGGKPFDCYKFRTMAQDAHERQRELYQQSGVDGPQFKIPNDPRVTPIGRVLRDWCIDEIPQLWNVLLGEMSLVGPRPSPFRENQICIPWRNARLSVRPGITGLWQICRSERSLGDFHQWIHFDILYVRTASYWLDLKIIIWTFLSLGGRLGVPVSRLIPRHKLTVWDPGQRAGGESSDGDDLTDKSSLGSVA